ncbi:hypothetical protein LCM10_10015 [Rossellomorea aquimaris]|uniref:hypothetical protein n=1 Tax=Rossellomorea aquimaris TaxID=189382 RepID=UPI001CD3DA9F|nr:hypothetical protein [Rossellomorea aquimaris]MCA1055319.1 hypothetical protein [Rossellomorea aquimaris]
MGKLFSKVFIITAICCFIVGGAAGALVYHVNDAAEVLKKEYEAEISSYFSERDMKVKNDVQALTESEIQRLKDETHYYLNEKLNENYQKELNEKSNEITKVTDQKIVEIKSYIDTLLKEKSE